MRVLERGCVRERRVPRALALTGRSAYEGGMKTRAGTLDGRVAVVTGSTRGLGSSMDVMVVGRRE
jgi:hypothetical protein